MSSLKRNMQRQLKRKAMNQVTPIKRNPAVKGVPLPNTYVSPVPVEGQPQQLLQEDVTKAVAQQAYYEGLRKGISTSFLFAIDCLEKSMQDTKGVGQKTTTALRLQFHQNLHTKDLFENFMGQDEPRGEVYIVNKEDQHVIELIKKVEDIVYAENSLLTDKELLSILSYAETPHDAINTMEDIIHKLITNLEKE